MTYNNIQYEVADNILTIILNRPEKLNAFNDEMRMEMIDAFDKADADDDVGAIIVTGNGRAFCAGADLSAGVKTFDYEKRKDRMEQFGNPRKPDGSIDYSHPSVRDKGGTLILRIFECLKPVIAAVNGPAVGVGATMLLPMDIRLASESAKFGYVFNRRGIDPDACSSWFLPRLVGMQQALDWVFTGRVFLATEALESGLVKSLYKNDELIPAARKLAREIIENTAPVSNALARQLMWRMLGADHPMEAHKIESRVIFSRGASEDAKEGVTSFLEKRPPKYTNKVSKNMPDFFPWWEERKYK